MTKYTVKNIDRNGNHYLIHVFYKDFSTRDIHAYDKIQLDEKITQITNDPTVHDYYIYVGIDFDVEEAEK